MADRRSFGKRSDYRLVVAVDRTHELVVGPARALDETVHYYGYAHSLLLRDEMTGMGASSVRGSLLPLG